MNRLAGAVMLMLLTIVLSCAKAQVPDLDSLQAERYQALTHELRCLVCQNQSIATSDAALAGDLRERVAQQIVEGRSDRQIRQYMVERYGQWILYDPPFQWTTLLLWLGPVALMLAGFAAVWRIMWRRPYQQPTQLSAAERRRLSALLGDAADHGPDDSHTRQHD